MSNYKMETKCVQSGYNPGNGEPRVVASFRAQHSVIQAVIRWDDCLTWKNPDIFIQDFRIRRMMR